MLPEFVVEWIVEHLEADRNIQDGQFDHMPYYKKLRKKELMACDEVEAWLAESLSAGQPTQDECVQVEPDENEYSNGDINDMFETLDAALLYAKPQDRSKEDRHYAILLTEFAKTYAYWFTFISKDGTLTCIN